MSLRIDSQALLYRSQGEVEFQSIGNGYYRSTDKLPVVVVVVNELEVTPKNYPLLLFASSKRKFRQFLQDAIQNNDSMSIAFSYYANPEITEEVVMAHQFTVPQENLEALARILGLKLMPFLDVEALAKTLGPKLAPFLDVSDRLAGLSLEERLRGLSAADRRKLMQLLTDSGTHNWGESTE